MAVTIGTQLGSLEITDLLGKGGMGEVYRARDLKLKRDVAIKILPEEFARDLERVSRFQREAEVLASLNHPNIAGIYDFEEANDAQFLVLELVEGETLAERIARGPIAVEEALEIAKHICDALEAAHEKGIIHRDLKPANVKVTRDGKVKVLDFGLAKALSATPESPSLSNSPTMLSGTMGGMIVGTAAYMSPEQARGRTVDARADIFSFGCVLFEMLTGQPPFDGEDVAEILSRVLQREPDWTLLPAEVPTGIRQVLRLCLEKDPRKRRRSAGDVRIDIEQASAPLEKAALEATTAPAVQRKNRIPWIGAAVFAIAAAAIAWTHLRESAPNAPLVQFEIVSKLSGRRTNASISPDGRWLAYYDLDSDSRPSLFLRNLSSMQSHVVPGSGAVTNVGVPYWSSDSRNVVFGGANYAAKVAAEGGTPQKIAESFARFASENRDGVMIQAAPGGIVRISATESQPVMLHAIPTEGGLATAGPPHFLPDGHHFVFTRINNKPEFNGIFAASLDPAEKPKRLTDGIAATPARDPETGAYYLLVTRDGQVTAQRFDPERLELSGEPQPIGPGLQVTAADNGVLAIEQGNSSSAVVAWYDRSGKIVRSSPPETALNSIDLSPDGSRLAVTVKGDLWLRDLLRGTATRFTTDPAGETIALWSPPGDRIVFDSTPLGGKASLWIKASTGAAAEEPLFSDDDQVWANDWSHDGRYLIYSQDNVAKSKLDLAVLPMDQPKENRKPISYLSGPFNKKQAQFSPNGRFVAYASDETGKFEIYVQPFPDPAGGKWPISSGGGVEPRWSKQGDELFYFSGKKLMAVAVKTASAFSAGVPHELFEAPVEPGYTNDGHRWVVAPDGNFLMQTFPPEISTSPITVIVNWQELLKKSKGK